MVTEFEQQLLVGLLSMDSPTQLEKATQYLRLRVHPTVHKIVRIGGGQKTDMETVLNDTVMDLIEMIRQGKIDSERAKLDSLIYAIVRNKWMDELKKRYQSQARRQEYAAELERRDTSTVAPVEQLLFSREERQRIVKALQQLKPDDRQLIEWKYLQGISLRIIAQRLGISEAAVKQRHLRCKQTLKKLLGK